MSDHFRKSLQNVSRLGDTDIFPFPIENHLFFDKEVESLQLLDEIDKDFFNYLNDIPPLYENNLATAGYTGFRWATQIDPFWNAYFLGLVISIGNDIEQARIARDRDIVFTYRFAYDESSKSMFDPTIGWRQFQDCSIRHAQGRNYVLICDIADFYPRVYHHRLENALKKATDDRATITKIMRLLSAFSGGISFGLPVGGPAARLLSELLLNRVDRLLSTNSITFCRFADDYHIFAESREEAYANLVFLNEKLLENEGLSIQKSKTRILTAEEFLATAAQDDAVETSELDSQQFLSLNLRYDPYSPTADDDYEKLKSELQRFDIVGMLAREMGKSRIHQTLTRRLLSAVRHIAPDTRNEAIKSLVDNYPVLYPVFPNVMMLLKSALSDLEPETQQYAFDKTRDLISSGSHITRVAVNLDYALRVLADDMSEETESLMVRAYQDTDRLILKRDIILIMAKRNADYWLSDIRKAYQSTDYWTKRSLIIASYVLEDEGKHWRDKIKRGFTPIESLVREWAAEKMQTGWNVPI